MARPFTSAYLLVCLLLVSTAGLAELRVNVNPPNTAVRNNIEAFIGPVEADNRRAMWRQARYSRDQAIDAAKALGYYDVRVRPRVTGSNDEPVLELNVTLGEPVRLRDVDIRVIGPGEGTAAFRRPDSPNLAPGARLHHGHYESAKSLINNQALRYGYFSGRFVESRLLIDAQAQQADISLLYDSGDRYRLGEVTFSETPFNEDLLRSMVTFESGEFYDAELLGEFNRDLLSTGYFENVQVLAPASQAVDGVIPVQATLSARKPHSLGFGGGYSTDVGARGRVSWTQHWLNAKGHSRGADLEISLPRQQLTTWYQIPLTPPQSSSLRFFTGVQKEDIEDVETESFVIGALHQRRLDNGWERAIGLRLEEERFKVGNDEGDATLLIPSIGFNRLKSDGGMDPSRGYSLAFEVQGAKEGFISDFDFLRVTGTARGLYTVQDRHRLLARAQLGGIASQSFERIPPSLRFFAGGDQSVRGYDFRTLSPIDETGDNIGGRYLIAGSLEYQYEFIDKWRGAVFVDHGNAVNSLEDPLESSVGVGIRWVSPIGPIRLDLAKSVSDTEQGFRIHFAMGPEL